MHATLAEVLRHSTIVPFAPSHAATQDTTLDGYKIAKVVVDHIAVKLHTIKSTVF